MASDDNAEETVIPEANEHKHDARHSEHEEDKSQVEPNGKESEDETSDKPDSDKTSKFKQFLQWFTRHKKISIPAAAVLLFAVLFAVPFTRYSALGPFIKQDFSVVVVDSQTGKPVSSALLSLKGKTVTTDGQGKASIRVPVGSGKLAVTKTYYKSSPHDVVVPIKKPAALSIKLEATGRPVPITILNGISGKAVAGATISADKTQAKTDDKGQTVLVVPADKKEVKATVSADGYNKNDITIKATTQEDEANTFKLTASGKIYFLSNQSGKIDLVKSDLDGKNRQTVLAGTGKETKGETVLLATRDWKYLALQSKRDGGDYAKLFLINTVDDSLVTMDEGDATFALTGWEEHRFIYRVDRVKPQQWESKKQAIKSYDADAKKLTTLDETRAEGSGQYNYIREVIDTVYVLNHVVVYLKSWNGSYNASLQGKDATLNSVSPAGGSKKVVKEFVKSSNTYSYLNARVYGVDELYLRFYTGDNKENFYEYEDGKVKDLPDMKSDDYDNATYATYLASPSGDKTFWSEDRDGKLSFFIGGTDGDDSKRVTALSTKYQTYGWYTNDYLLVSKDGSELFIMPVSGVEKEEQLFKITDYYRPVYTYRGYGGGYGGL